LGVFYWNKYNISLFSISFYLLWDADLAQPEVPELRAVWELVGASKMEKNENTCRIPLFFFFFA
jgi:hypothetical protein